MRLPFSVLCPRLRPATEASCRGVHPRDLGADEHPNGYIPYFGVCILLSETSRDVSLHLMNIPSFLMVGRPNERWSLVTRSAGSLKFFIPTRILENIPKDVTERETAVYW
ncbi:hypothetical protein AHF37_07213 [Paragonimus kellicotti]|nr:hypothetical protein AHF37_07213 [Paragonimus kellicotti]